MRTLPVLRRRMPPNNALHRTAFPRRFAAAHAAGHGASLVWTVEADSHFEAMSRYYEFMGWGEYKTDHEEDRQPYADDWLAVQRSSAPKRAV